MAPMSSVRGADVCDSGNGGCGGDYSALCCIAERLHCQPDGTRTYLARQYPCLDVQNLVLTLLWVNWWASYLDSCDGRAVACGFVDSGFVFWIRLSRLTEFSERKSIVPFAWSAKCPTLQYLRARSLGVPESVQRCKKLN